MVPGAETVIVVVDVAEAHTPFVTVHVKTFAPVVNPDTLVVAEFGVPMVSPAGPVHTPVPREVPAVSVAVVTLHKD